MMSELQSSAKSGERPQLKDASTCRSSQMGLAGCEISRLERLITLLNWQWYLEREKMAGVSPVSRASC